MDKTTDWTISTLKEHLEAKIKYNQDVSDLKILQIEEASKAKFASNKELGDLKFLHNNEIRLLDQKAIDLSAQNTAIHFEGLNENAGRIKEERGHFLAVEVFNPFKDQVIDWMARNDGKSSGLSAGWAILIGILTLVATVIGTIGAIIGIITFFTR